MHSVQRTSHCILIPRTLKTDYGIWLGKHQRSGEESYSERLEIENLCGKTKLISKQWIW